MAKVLENYSLVNAANGDCHITGFRDISVGFAGTFELKRWGDTSRALVCHSRSDLATLPFSKVIHVCLSAAVCVVIWPHVAHVGPLCVIVTPCVAVKTSCPSPGQLNGGFETAAWIASLYKWLGLALAMLKLDCFSPLNDLLCL